MKTLTLRVKKKSSNINLSCKIFKSDQVLFVSFLVQISLYTYNQNNYRGTFHCDIITVLLTIDLENLIKKYEHDHFHCFL